MKFNRKARPQAGRARCLKKRRFSRKAQPFFRHVWMHQYLNSNTLRFGCESSHKASLYRFESKLPVETVRVPRCEDAVQSAESFMG